MESGWSKARYKRILLIGEDDLMGERLSKAQRKAILERDGYTSQMRHYSEEKGFYTNDNCPYDGRPCPHLHVHHIQPVRVGGVNEPENLITIFSCEHTGICPDSRIR